MSFNILRVQFTNSIRTFGNRCFPLYQNKPILVTTKPFVANNTKLITRLSSNNNANNDNDNNGTCTNTQNRSINASKNDRKQRHREKSDNREIPTGPPEMMRDPTTDSFSSHAYSWPIAFAVVPPMGALIYGKSDVWSDFLLLLLIAFYLYNIIKGM